MVKINEKGKPISEAEIALLEQKVGAKLSDMYRRFLISNNGGIPTPDIIDIEGLLGSPTDVQVFFGIGRNIASSNLAWNFDFIAERCPGHNVLPIACDSGGNLFCLKISQGIASEVLYCDLAISTAPYVRIVVAFFEIDNWGRKGQNHAILS